ncbi:hypothetical protein KBY99_01685 [Cyanobium sp. Maggiore-St4-Cus]|uniref:hypothetical protein n=1 Tax=Cyanobium sp. Maggiore-St4-Cus TaxID=2823717 RepID=UPI0020CEC692|nr:hypothetical protein [Cyanobium sp. Maggiore-St4-Cus]MCP9787688.1 hypothetical protein [Cyanobium sp. Maggiore-St4-Cus]
MTVASVPSDSIASLALAWSLLFRRFLPLLAALAAGLALLLLFTNPERLPVYLVAVGAGFAIMAVSSARSTAVLPVFPLYVLLQALSFASPLFAREIVADWRVLITGELLASCVLPLLLWFLALWLGWILTPLQLGRMRPRRPLTDALRNPGFLPHWSLAIASGLQLLLNSPLYWQLPGALAQGLLTPLRTLVGLAGIAGAFTGAYAWPQGRLPSRAVWLVLLVVPLAVSLGSLLLSSLQGIIFSALLGLWLGRSRQALAITLAGLFLIGFLNTGKAAIRGIYWSQGASMPSNPIVLLQEWVEVSLASVSKAGEDGPGNIFTDRFNNLQNLLYVQQGLLAGTPTLGGGSLSAIPQALVPRFLNPNKGRSQEGQVLLNLHFGRQRSVEDTEKVYIAWGFLAEGVGNFGSSFGPLLMGISTGCLLRITENLGRGQLILSTPGLLSLALTVFWLTTYEMAASTFAAAVFQIVVVVMLVGWWFGRQSPRRSQLA